MRIISLDFESFWDQDYTLKKLTTTDYVRDPRFEVIGVAVSIDSQPAVWMEESQFRYFITRVPAEQLTFTAHHAHFDGLILSEHYNVTPGRWLCTLQMSRAKHQNRIGNSLDALLNHYGYPRKGDYAQKMRGLRRHQMTPAQWLEYGEYSKWDCTGHQWVLSQLLPNFSRDELDLQDMTIRMFTEPMLEVSTEVLERCVSYERTRKIELLYQCGILTSLTPTQAELDLAKKALSSNDSFSQLLAFLHVETPMKTSAKGNVIPAFAKTDPEFQALVEHEDEDVRILCEARLAVKSTTNETRAQRLIRMGTGGRPCPVYLRYCGAHTWRWSGGDAVNWQNFERTSKKDPNKGLVRHAVRAPKGYVVVVADSAQIQARLNAWFNGQLDLVADFANGVDVYSKFASRAFGRPIDRKGPNPDDQTPGQLGKVCELGLGFGMGWYKLALEVLKGAQGAPPIQFDRSYLKTLDIDPSRFLANPRNIQRVREMPSRLPIGERLIHCAVANYFVDFYRKNRAQIKAGWDNCERMLGRLHLKQYGPCFYLGIMEACEEGFRGPDGTILHYPYLQLGEGGFSYLSGRNKRSKLYGGLVDENIIQYLERVIMARFMLRLKREYLLPQFGPKHARIVWTSHDEVTSVVPEAYGQECLDMQLKLLNEPPAWAPGLPLSSEGGFGRVYGEIK